MEPGIELTKVTQMAALLGYLLGTIPFGLLLTRMAGLGDLRKVGSGNIGATNVLRTGNKGLAAATLLLDGGKGAAAVLIAGALWDGNAALLAALFVVIGHNFPIWLKFEGGKGVATTLGVLLALSWPAGLLACLTWLAAAMLTRYSSAGALAAFAGAPFYVWFVEGDQRMTTIVILLALLGIARHHTNIRRLLKGEEPKIGKKAAPPETGEDG